MKMGGEGFEELAFLHNTKLSSIGGTKKIILKEGFGRFWRACITCSNLIYVDKIFLN